MGVPVPEMNPADDGSAEALLGSLRTIAAAERRKHASLFNYWLSIRGDREFPPIRDLDPMEISDAGPFSILLEMVGGGEDAEIRHLGQAIKGAVDAEKVSDAANPSLLSCIATRLPVVAACRQAFAFEDEFEDGAGRKRCWVTLLPFSATGTWIDFVYGFVTLDPSPNAVEEERAEAAQAESEPTNDVMEPAEAPAEPVDEVVAPEPADEIVEPEVEVVEPEPPLELAEDPEAEAAPPQFDSEPETGLEPEPEPEAPEAAAEPVSPAKPSFAANFIEKMANGFYGSPTTVELDLESARLETGEANEPEPAEEPEPADETQSWDEPESPAEPNPTSEGTLQSKLTEVRAKADEARQAKLRANAALYEGLAAAYDFALDAESEPEEYLKLVEAQGLKIQLRSPMQPVVKLAFDGLCDDSTIAQLEAVLAWALKNDFPRGSLAEQIESAGGVGAILNGQPSAA